MDANFKDSDMNMPKQQPLDLNHAASDGVSPLPAELAARIDAIFEQGLKDPAEIGRLADLPMGAAISRLGVLELCHPPADLLSRTLKALPKRASVPQARTPVERKYVVPVGFNQRAVDIWVMAAAACVLVVVMFFGLSQAQVHALRFACARNLQVVGRAMAQYASNNAGRLPEIALPADRNWLPRNADSGAVRSANAHSNLANLSSLIDGPARYTSWERLVCPAQPVSAADLNAERCPTWGSTGYSYVDQLGPYHHHWVEAEMVPIMADANPIVCEFCSRTADANSVNHGGYGQNVLFNDGGVVWETSADVGPDHHNIWTVGDPAILQYNGTQEPRHWSSVFLVP
ncbi:MAG: hypothetical protein ACP5O1_10005 [Phycisphaerae bacterium]